MSINIKQLNKYIVTPTLKEIELYSTSARNLLLGTCAQESKMGTYIHQIGGCAVGIYQCEPATHKDIWESYLYFHTPLMNKLMYAYKLSPTSLNLNDILIFNLAYATAICRVHYLRVAESLPAAGDIGGLANYWKRFYNTKRGKGTVEQFIDNYKHFEIDKL